MTLPKKLQEARDNAVTRIVKGYDDIDGHDYDVCRKGFDSCYQILAPEIDKFVEALQSHHRIWKHDLTEQCSAECGELCRVLAKWREFTGAK